MTHENSFSTLCYAQFKCGDSTSSDSDDESQEALSESPSPTATLAPINETPFPFMLLPAELWNHVYELAAADLRDHRGYDEYARHLGVLIRRNPPKGSSESYMGLCTASRALRQEFRPIFMHDYSIGVWVSNLNGVLAAFFSSSNIAKGMYPIGADIFYDKMPKDGFDLLPLMRARAGTRGRVSWFVDARSFIDPGTKAASFMMDLHSIVDISFRGFLGDVVSGLIVSITFHRSRRWCGSTPGSMTSQRQSSTANTERNMKVK